MKGNSDIKILEILAREPVSLRLQNAMFGASAEGKLPFESLSEYLQAKEENIQRLYRIPNLGQKSIRELIAVLDKYIGTVADGNNHAFYSHGNRLKVRIPESYKGIGIVTFIRTTQCSVRLENALANAVEQKQFGWQTLGDLAGKSIHDLRGELRKVPNMGNKTIQEFIDLLNSLAEECDEELGEPLIGQGNLPMQSDSNGEKSDFATLLRNEHFANLTVPEIILRTPGLSKLEEKLLQNLDPVYRNYPIPLRELLNTFDEDIDELSARILPDVQMAPQLASLLMDFYRYLLSKKQLGPRELDYFDNDFSVLEARQAEVLLARLGDVNQTLEALGQRFGVTRERIRQIESKALKTYGKGNRIGLFHLSESIERYAKASKGVLSVDTLQHLYQVSKERLEVALKFVVSGSEGASLIRDGNFIISEEFRRRRDQLFTSIENFLDRHGGGDSQAVIEEFKLVSSTIVQYFIFRYQKKFVMNAEGYISVVIKSASERARIVLAAAGQPVHTSEASRLYKTIFKDEVSEHALGATLGRLEDVLIVGPGTYALYSQLSLSAGDIDSLRDDAYALIQGKGRYVSSRIIFEHLCRTRPEFRRKEPHFNYHLVLGALQDDERFRTRRGFMVGLPSFEEYLSLETEIGELVETHGPVSIPDLIELLRPTRGELTNGSVRNSLLACEEIYLTAEKRQWDVADRVFNDPADLRRLQTAIRMAAYKESVALSSVFNRVRSTGIECALGTILSVVWKDPYITLERDYVRFDGTDAEIERYYASGEPTDLWQLDYRNHTEEKSVDTGMLDALVQEFDLYV